MNQNAFSYLSPTDQLDLHKYFQFASDKTEPELLEHRRSVHELDRSLPQRAGRAYGRLARGERSPVNYTVLPGGRRISVRVVMRPEPDIKMLAKVFMKMALDDVDTRMRRERKLNRAAIRATYSPHG